MRMQKIMGYCCSLLLTGSLGGCSESERTPVAGRYYTSYSEDGDPGVYFDDAQQGATELEYASAVGVAKDYVVAHENKNENYLFPVAATTAEAARSARVGPLTDAACKQKLFQLTGDSLRLRSLINF
jgi:hypothetical protein